MGDDAVGDEAVGNEVVGDEPSPTASGSVSRNSEVDDWLSQRDHPLDAEMRAVRAIILAADDRVEESIKWQTPTFSYRGNIASFSPTKKMISLMFHRGAEIPGHHPHLVGDARLVRNMRFRDMTEIEARRPDLEAVIRAWCDARDGTA